MEDLLRTLFTLLDKKSMTLVTAESCTGGLLAATITHKAGASNYFERGYVTYSNQSKIDCLGVPEDTLNEHGAVSEETAEFMAKGALIKSHADLAVSITGIAGPDGGSEDKPVGTVFFGYALKGGSSGAIKHAFKGLREDIQKHAAHTALHHVIEILSEGEPHE